VNKWAFKKRHGFTIVELLIVIVVIAILAAISVVAYTGIQNRANNSTVEADIANMIKLLEMTKVDLGHYPQTLAQFPSGFKFSKSAYDTSLNNIYYAIDIPEDRYAIGVRSKSNRGYLVVAGSVTPDVTVNGLNTAVAAGLDAWENVPNEAAVFQGYTSSTGNWSSSWKWTN
jgi:prepilin-type N-terminal cleavage/methylation domain-containing protein